MDKWEDISEFEEDWVELASEICQATYTKPETLELKTKLQKNGYLTDEEQSQFIEICNQIKYECIYKRFGEEGSEGYKKFSTAWQKWFEHKGVESLKVRDQRSSVDHILFGSTPDPVQFLLHFEEEILGRMKRKKRE